MADNNIDARTVGLAAKDIVIGVAAAVVGGYGGGAAAEGVRDAGRGIDRLVDQLAPAGDKKTRAQSFDSTDFATRPAQEPRKEEPAIPPEPRSPASTGPALGDSRVTAEYLAVLGWSRQEIDRIMTGPIRPAPTAPASQQAPGGSVPAVDGQTLAAVIGKVLPQVAGKASKTPSGDATE